jgi:HK97 family phage portal protein
MTGLFNLNARQHESRVLNAWLDQRDGSADRLGRGPSVQTSGQNAVTTNMSAQELVTFLGASATSAAGASVTPSTALRVSAVYGCVSLIAGAISTLPVGIYEREGETRKRADHEYWWLFNEQACETMTSAAAWEYMIMAKLFYGDAFAELLRPSFGSGRVIGWQPLHPLSVQPFKTNDGDLLYRIQPTKGASYVRHPEDVLHLPSLGFDGLTSPSPITYAARESIGSALASEEFSARFFSQGATADIALKTTKDLSQAQADLLRASFVAKYGGGKNNRIPLVLAGGLEFESLSMNNVDAALLPTRYFTVEEICRIFGVPPYMVGHTDKATSFGTGIEQQGMGFVRYTLQRHLTPIKQELNRKLWPTRSRYFAEHITDALERGDLKSRYEAHRIALGRAGEQPWMTADEVRRIENMPPNPELKINPGASNAQPTPAAAG